MHAVTFFVNGRLHLPYMISITVVWEWIQLCQLEYLGPEGPGGIRNTDLSIIGHFQAHTRYWQALYIRVNPQLEIFLG